MIFVVLAAAVILGLAGLSYALSRFYESQYPPRGKRVDVGPGVVHMVETQARGRERAAVVLVHGASGNFADLHNAVAGELSELGFRVFSVDRPGHGWSDRLGERPEAASPQGQARWIREALRVEGVEEAIVVVHSLGGVLGLAMALDAPDFVRGLVLLAPVSHPWPGGVSLYYTIAASRWLGPAFRWLIVPFAGLVYLEPGLKGVFAPNPTPPDYVRRTGLKLMFRPWHFRSNAEDVVDCEGHVRTLSPRYGEIQTPTAIITGDSDSVVYAHIHSTGCARDIEGATLSVLEGVGHSPHYAAPQAVIEAVVEVDRRAEAGRQVVGAARAGGEFAQ
jgi:pimeloyl-ACP methyl ester carboxylesterase